ncbi:MAG: DegT/DnrJ/EryC1/StrS family aminotransferase, partial [Gammaproteobacteria bacterium]|nr:DegT/DnrJ/EryC1/StrS family aminotransferase [Gammaproteobacteria bacterium]
DLRVVIFVKDAEKTMKYLIKNGVESRSMFYPLHKQPCYRFLGYKDNDFPNSIECYSRGICLPTWVGLTESQIRYISQIVKESLG